jgi:transposase
VYYIGLDIHKKTISYCVREADGTVVREGSILARRQDLDHWIDGLQQPCLAGMEATMFTSWVYDHMTARGMTVKVAHSAMLKAITAGKKKNDTVDARKLADLLRCDFFPECYIAERNIRDRRRVLRYRNLLVHQAVRMKNRVSALLMESGVPYNKNKLHQKKYFHQLLDEQKYVMPGSLPQLLRLSRSTIEYFTGMERQLVKALGNDALLRERVQRLMDGAKRRPHSRADVGTGDRRCKQVPILEVCHQLLRIVRRRAKFSGQVATHADFEAA